MQKTLLRSKLHRINVTQVELDYEDLVRLIPIFWRKVIYKNMKKLIFTM